MFIEGIKKHWQKIFLGLSALIFFIIYLYLYLPHPVKYPDYLILNQPDESINYFFIRELTINNQHSYIEPLSKVALNQVHPRSTTVVNGSLVPIGFPGIIIIFGFILKVLIKIFGSNNFNILAVSLTPLLAALTPIIFYVSLKRVFNEKIALVSAFLLFILPPWWYYASRPFQHNTLFIFLIVSLFSCFIVSLEKKVLRQKTLLTFLAGLFFGLAVYVRPSEIVWLLILAIYGLIAARRAWSWQQYLSFAVGLVLAMILFFYTQIAFYGQILGSGYVKPEITGAAGSILSGPQGINFIKAIFLPFGFHPKVMWNNFVAYFVSLFGLWTALGILGFRLFFLGWLKKNTQESSKILKYLSLLLFISLYLLIFYGSWFFYDNLLLSPSIGTSYVRYFLPIYVFSLPLIAWFFVSLWSWRGRVGKVFLIIILVVLLATSFFEVFFRLEGLKNIKTTIAEYQNWQEQVLIKTEPDSLIVTNYADKYLFPLRKVIPGWHLDEQISAIGNLLKTGLSIYLYDLHLDQSNEKDLQNHLAVVGAKLGPVIEGWENLELRRILNIKD